MSVLRIHKCFKRLIHDKEKREVHFTGKNDTIEDIKDSLYYERPATNQALTHLTLRFRNDIAIPLQEVCIDKPKAQTKNGAVPYITVEELYLSIHKLFNLPLTELQLKGLIEGQSIKRSELYESWVTQTRLERFKKMKELQNSGTAVGRTKRGGGFFTEGRYTYRRKTWEDILDLKQWDLIPLQFDGQVGLSEAPESTSKKPVILIDLARSEVPLEIIKTGTKRARKDEEEGDADPNEICTRKRRKKAK